MASVMIVTRQTKDGPRYHVRYRLGGRTYPVRHAGAFRTMKEARARRDLVAGELAAGRNPGDTLRALVDQPTRRTLAEWVESYRESRVDLAPQTVRALRSHLGALGDLRDLDPQTIRPSHVQTWIASLEMKPASVARYLATLRSLLDFAGADPNPARSEHVRLPRDERRPVEPPSAAEVETIIGAVPRRWRLALRVLAETGLRVGELHSLQWADVDEVGSRFRIKGGKTRAARRWVPVPEELIAEIAERCAREDRTPERHVFPGATPSAARGAMSRACKATGLALYSPHDLRHRWASVQVARGVPLPQVAAALGHSRSSLTLDVYSHVLFAETDA